jgi:hypothetical protein
MSYELSWTFATNVVPTDRTGYINAAKSFFLQAKNFLVANGWTLTSSSNGSVADTSDNISSLTDCVSATEGNSHAWYVLKSPEGFRAASDGSYTGDGSRLWFCYSLNAAIPSTQIFKFSLTDFTGGSTSATPAGTSELATTNASIINTAASPGYSGTEFSFACATDGSFCLRTSYSALGKLYASLEVRKLYDCLVKTSDGNDYPYGCLITMYGSGSAQTVTTSTAITQNYSWGIDASLVKCTLLTLRDGTGVIGVNTGTSGDAVNGVNEASEVMAYIDTAGYRGRIGRIPDFFITGATIPTGTVDNLSPVEYCINGNTWLVTDAAFTI